MPSYRNRQWGTDNRGAVLAGNGSVTIPTRHFANGGVGVQIVGITSATVTFEASCDQVPTWVSILATNVTSGTTATTTTADGIYTINVVGLQQVRARVSTYVSGNILITMIANPG
jgi:hypothetical protein